MVVDLQPFLEGGLIALRPLKQKDREGLFAVAADPLIWEQHPKKDRCQRPVFDAFFDALIRRGGALLALNAKTGQMIGSSCYYDWDPAKKSVAIGYTFLARACWGQGYNREMKKLMLNHAFHFADAVFFHIGKNNTRSRKAIEKIGAEFVREIEAILPEDGRSYPYTIYQLSRARGMR